MKLGFLKRMSINFYDELALKIIYFSLIQSQMKYASLIWHIDNIDQNTNLSAIQNNFFRFLLFKCNIKRNPHSRYQNIG